MTRHYSPRDFFRQMPDALLARYFNMRGVLQDFDFTERKETKFDVLFSQFRKEEDIHANNASTSACSYYAAATHHSVCQRPLRPTSRH